MDAEQIIDINKPPIRLHPNLWYLLKFSGETPSSRVGHTATYLPTKKEIILMGGAIPGCLFGEVWLVNLATLSCTKISTKGNFPMRYEHCTFMPNIPEDLDEGKKTVLWVFAGADMESNKNDLWEFNVESSSWKNINQNGSIPSGRTLHSTTSVMGQDLMVFAGGDIGAEPVSDSEVHKLNVVTKTWSTVKTTGCPPSARHGHILVAVDNKLYCHGGMRGKDLFDDLHILDDHGKWTQLADQEIRPCKRAAHGAVVFQGIIYVFGGLGEDGALNDLWKLHLDNNTWEEVIINSFQPSPRLDFAMTIVQLPSEFKSKTSEEKDGKMCENISREENSFSPFIFIHGGMNTYGDLFDDACVFRLSLD